MTEAPSAEAIDRACVSLRSTSNDSDECAGPNTGESKILWYVVRGTCTVGLRDLHTQSSKYSGAGQYNWHK